MSVQANHVIWAIDDLYDVHVNNAVSILIEGDIPLYTTSKHVCSFPSYLYMCIYMYVWNGSERKCKATEHSTAITTCLYQSSKEVRTDDVVVQRAGYVGPGVAEVFKRLRVGLQLRDAAADAQVQRPHGIKRRVVQTFRRAAINNRALFSYLKL